MDGTPTGQGGRLKKMTTGSLQDLRYTYEATGNVRKIEDYKAVAGTTQVQDFTYDVMDRLRSAHITGGTLGLDGVFYDREYYNYDDKGRLTGLPWVGTYDYSANHAHAVEKLNGVQKYWYDANGNMTSRVVNANTFNLAYDADNHLVSVSGAATNTYTYNGNGQRVQETAYENLAAGMPLTSTVMVRVPEATTDGDTWADSGNCTQSGECTYIISGYNYVQLDLGAVYTADKVKVFHWAGDGRTFHNTKTEISTDGVNWTTIFDSAVSGEYAETAAGKTHTFSATGVRYVRDWLNGSTANEGNFWVEIEVYGSRTTAYIGNYLEWRVGDANPLVKYYYLGSQRIAMRTGSGSGTHGLVYLLGDRLGSTALTADGASGAKLSELRYVWGATMTGYRYTGQRMEGTGLYDYGGGTRWYDPSIMRWTSPDSIVPLESQGVQAWDRYAFVNNNPVRYTDPTGHSLACGVTREDCGGNISDQEKLERIRELRENDRTQDREVPFDASLGGNVKDPSEDSEPPNPSFGGIVVAGVALTAGILVTEFLLIWAEVAVTPVVVATPVIEVPMEAVLIGCSLTLADIDIAYWSYAARVYQNPNEKQELELLPLWGLGGD